MRRFLCLIAAFFSVAALPAQETDGAEVPVQDIFPLTLVLEGALYAGDGCGSWRPDWPLRLPPDAFRVKNGEISRALVEWNGASFDYRFGSRGLIEEFPFMLNGRMVQVSLVYGELSALREMTLTFPSGDVAASGDIAAAKDIAPPENAEEEAGVPPEEPYHFEFLESRDNFPVLVRVSRANVWYFIYFTWGMNEAAETWYDEWGNFVGAYGFTLSEIGKNPRLRTVREYAGAETGFGSELSYGSRGFLTDAAGSGGVYRVLYYLENLPRYWERRPSREDAAPEESGKFSLQWDERGLLVRITRERDGDGETPDNAQPAGYRYEYTFDERGNWTERREVLMYRRPEFLLPSGGTTVRRTLEYSE